MKHQFLLFLALLGAVLLWPGCDDDDDVVVVGCPIDVPTIPYSTDCEPDIVNLVNLNTPQTGNLPNLPVSCSSSPGSRVFRVNGSDDGDFYLHIYVGIPAAITYEVFGGDCEDGFVTLRECVTSRAIAIADVIEDMADFPDVYVRIKFDIFTGSNYVNYALTSDSYIGIVTYDELPKALSQSGGIPYNDSGEAPEFLPYSCDESSFQRIILTSCNPEANVDLWAQEIGLPVSERYSGDGGTVIAVDIPEGMSPNFAGDGNSGPGEAITPLTTERRAKVDSADLIVEKDHIITISSEGEGLYTLDNDCGNAVPPTQIGPEGVCFKPSLETLECLTFRPGKPSAPEGSVVVTMIDSGADDAGALGSLFRDYSYRGSDNFQFLQSNELGYDFIRGDDEPDDEIGHGSATAATVIGSYTGSAPLTVVHYKVFGIDNQASYFGALISINSAVDAKSDLINMSWGLPLEQAPPALECAISRGNGNGIMMITTAGNESLNIDEFPQWPGAFSASRFKYDGLITVGSMAYPDYNLNEDPQKVDYSNFSPGSVDIAAYLTAATPRFRGGSLNDINYIAGTSISAPIVTSSIAGFIGPNGNNVSNWAVQKTNRSGPLESEGHVRNGIYLPLCENIISDLK